MKAITLRGLSGELAGFIEAEAARTGKSLNATVIGLLERAAGLGGDSRARTKKRDLSSFAGSWKKEEADEFDHFLAEHRKVDPEIWQ